MLRTPALRVPVRAIKRAASDVWWTWKGRGIGNPPMPGQVRSMLFVCLGNICRSPFAEQIARRRRAAAGPELVCASAGLRTNQAAGPPSEARRVAAMFGVSLEAHRPQPLTRELVDRHQLIVVMESAHRDRVVELFPDLADRVFLLPLFERGVSGMGRYNIADPFGQPQGAFEACYDRIDRAVSRLLVAAGHASGDQPHSAGSRSPR